MLKESVEFVVVGVRQTTQQDQVSGVSIFRLFVTLYFLDPSDIFELGAASTLTFGPSSKSQHVHAISIPNVRNVTSTNLGAVPLGVSSRNSSALTTLPPELIHRIFRFLNACSSACLGLACKVMLNIHEYFYPHQISLFVKNFETRACLGRLLTNWMSLKYSFDFQGGNFYRRNTIWQTKRLSGRKGG